MLRRTPGATSTMGIAYSDAVGRNSAASVDGHGVGPSRFLSHSAEGRSRRLLRLSSLDFLFRASRHSSQRQPTPERYDVPCLKPAPASSPVSRTRLMYSW